MRNRDTSIHCPLQGSKHLVSSCGSGQACIEVTAECTRLSINTLHIKFVAGDLHLAFVHLIKAEFVQQLKDCTMVWLKQRFIYAY